ncbi:MAG: hypothetical protein MR740_00615 [Clostridium sp.]|nr:hypothetical protein [Clostridium sp.]MDD7139599.1 hypothetical protein [Clostridium sp.]MDY6080714.1 hypothetical protein [Eubacteriales bacterium]
MNKSVYSLVLTDDVVAEIDRIAYENGTSRSNTVNQILAEYVSYDTPEKRIREVFSEVENLLTGSSRFQVMMQPSDSMFSLRSALAYKYNPTVRYSVELNRNLQPAIGELRVSVRSQSSALRLYMLQFFKLWSRIEQNLVGHVECAMADDRYIRRLAVAEDRKLDNEALGQAIAEYIRLFDTALKLFFNHLDQPETAIARVESLYGDYLRKNSAIL